MQILVPAADFSIGTNPTNGDRQLQYEHITWDSGTGPFEIDPDVQLGYRDRDVFARDLQER
jgi:hypothetical protein